MDDALRHHVLRQGDRSLILAQRLLEVVTHAPDLEEDLALSNVALDLLGQTRVLYTYAGALEGAGHDEDHFAYWRRADEFANPLMVEQPNGDFAQIMTRQFLHDAFASVYWGAMTASTDADLAALAAKAVKETAYHLRHSRGWVVRLGDGTDESHRRMLDAIGALWPYTDDLVDGRPGDEGLVGNGVVADPERVRAAWSETVTQTLEEATLSIPTDVEMIHADHVDGHTDSFAALIAELQVTARAHPGATW